VFWRSLNFKLLQNAGTEDVELLVSQSLSEADSLPDSKRGNLVAVDKVAIVIKEPVWIERVRIGEGFGIIHDFVQASKDN